jgi:N-acetylmuramoyl-L-alanine amidase
LVEAVFLSNDSEARQVATPEFRQKIAEAIADGIRRYAAVITAIQPPDNHPVATLSPAPASGAKTSS